MSTSSLGSTQQGMGNAPTPLDLRDNHLGRFFQVCAHRSIGQAFFNGVAEILSEGLNGSEWRIEFVGDPVNRASETCQPLRKDQMPTMRDFMGPIEIDGDSTIRTGDGKTKILKMKR